MKLTASHCRLYIVASKVASNQNTKEPFTCIYLHKPAYSCIYMHLHAFSHKFFPLTKYSFEFKKIETSDEPIYSLLPVKHNHQKTDSTTPSIP